MKEIQDEVLDEQGTKNPQSGVQARSGGIGVGTVEMYDPLGHFVDFESHGGFSYESGRKRNTTQATSSRARS